jgi:hypothetical protein
VVGTKQLPAPQETATPKFQAIKLTNTLLLFAGAVGMSQPNQAVGYLSSNKQVLISEGVLDQQSGMRRIWIKVAVEDKRLLGDGSPKGVQGNTILSSTIEKSEVGLLKNALPAVIVGVSP